VSLGVGGEKRLNTTALDDYKTWHTELTQVKTQYHFDTKGQIFILTGHFLVALLNCRVQSFHPSCMNFNSLSSDIF
jgi:hypothetical protein